MHTDVCKTTISAWVLFSTDTYAEYLEGVVTGLFAMAVVLPTAIFYIWRRTILRFVFWHSIALACLVGILVMLQAASICLHWYGRALNSVIGFPINSASPRWG